MVNESHEIYLQSLGEKAMYGEDIAFMEIIFPTIYNRGSKEDRGFLVPGRVCDTDNEFLYFLKTFLCKTFLSLFFLPVFNEFKWYCIRPIIDR